MEWIKEYWWIILIVVVTIVLIIWLKPFTFQKRNWLTNWYKQGGSVDDATVMAISKMDSGEINSLYAWRHDYANKALTPPATLNNEVNTLVAKYNLTAF